MLYINLSTFVRDLADTREEDMPLVKMRPAKLVKTTDSKPLPNNPRIRYRKAVK